MGGRMGMIPLMEPDDFLPYAIDGMINDVDYLLFSVNERSWGDENIVLTQENREWITKLSLTNPKFRLLIGNWDKEHKQHNAASEYAISLGCDIIINGACDQVYAHGATKKMIDTLENSDADILRAQWYTFWKLDPLCVIWPPEQWCPVLAIKPKQFKYTDVADGMVLKDGQMSPPKCVFVNLQEAAIYHFCFSRSDQFVKRKMQMSSHHHQMVPGWYDNVWLPYKTGDKNLHPCWPTQYPSAVPFPLEQLPPRIRGYFKMQQEKLRWKNIRY